MGERNEEQWLPPPPPDYQDPAAKNAYWPERVKVELEVEKQRRLNALAERDRPHATDDALERALHENLWREASAGITRIHDAAKWLETAAAALAGLYTTALGVTFAIKDNPLPTRGFIPVLFFGLAVGMTAFYLAFVGSAKGPGRPKYDGSLPEQNWEKSEYFADYALATAHARAGWLRAAVVALLFGILFMPAPYLDVSALGTQEEARNDTSNAEAVAALPTPPAGNDEAGASWYERVLAEHDKAQASPALSYVRELGFDVSLPLDVWLAAVGLGLYLLVVLLVTLFVPTRAVDSGGPVVVTIDEG